MSPEIRVLKPSFIYLFAYPIEILLRYSSIELETLHHLLEAQVLLSQWQFLQALLHLQEAKVKLGEWNASLLPAEVKVITLHVSRQISK